jgi:hypothetical protein
MLCQQHLLTSMHQNGASCGNRNHVERMAFSHVATTLITLISTQTVSARTRSTTIPTSLVKLVAGVGFEPTVRFR